MDHFEKPFLDQRHILNKLTIGEKQECRTLYFYFFIIFFFFIYTILILLK